MSEGPDLCIREYAPEDFTDFFQVMRDAIRLTCAAAYGIEATTAWVADGNPSFRFVVPQHAFVMVQNDEIIAVGGWTLTDQVALHPAIDTIAGSPSHVRINAVYVKPGFEGQGFGQKMVRHMEQHIISTSPVRDVYLWATLNAVSFYERLGFTPGAEQSPEVAPGHKIKVSYMGKILA